MQLPGIGRDTHVGDTIIGIKGRVAFEAAFTDYNKAHLLEKHVLTKSQLYWKEQLSTGSTGQMMHEAQYLDQVMRNREDLS